MKFKTAREPDGFPRCLNFYTSLFFYGARDARGERGRAHRIDCLVVSIFVL